MKEEKRKAEKEEKEREEFYLRKLNSRRGRGRSWGRNEEVKEGRRSSGRRSKREEVKEWGKSEEVEERRREEGEEVLAKVNGKGIGDGRKEGEEERVKKGIT